MISCVLTPLTKTLRYCRVQAVFIVIGIHFAIGLYVFAFNFSARLAWVLHVAQCDNPQLDDPDGRNDAGAGAARPPTTSALVRRELVRTVLLSSAVNSVYHVKL